MVAVQTWIGFSADKRQKLIDNGNVQFFRGDMPIAAEDAQVLLGLARPVATEVERRASERIPIEPQEPVVQELQIQQAVNVMYVRFQHQRWVVGRYTGASEGKELSVVRGRSNPDIYNLDSWYGATILSADLIADSVGMPGDALSYLDETAVDHFRNNFVEAFLGTGSWQVSALQIRESLALNPYLRMAYPG